MRQSQVFIDRYGGVGDDYFIRSDSKRVKSLWD